MAEESKKIVPQVDDAYWFDFSKKVVDTAITRRDEAAGNLQKLVLWLWGIYTSSATIGFALSGKELSFGYTLIIASASILLIFVYWCTVWIQLPSLVKFDVRSPDDIKEAYNTMVITRNKKMVFTVFLSIIATVMVSVGLMVASISKPEKTQASMEALLLVGQNENIVSFSGALPNASSATIVIEPISSDVADKASPITMKLVPLQGIIQSSTKIDKRYKSALVRFIWMDGKATEYQIAKNAKNASTAN
jgi:hypothetical protein